MRVTCSICKDVFSIDCEICAIECGHLFHKSCINEWCRTSLTCPHCRFKLKQTPFCIQFEVKNNTEQNFHGSECEQLVQDLQVLLEEEKELKLKYELVKEKFVKLREEACEAKKKVKKLKHDVTVWKQEYNYLKRAHEMAQHLEADNKELEKKISLYISLEKIIYGTASDMYQVLEGVPVTSSTIEELSKFVQVMRQKLKINQESYKKHNDDLNHLTEAVKKEYIDLQSKKENLKLFDKSVQTDEMPIRKWRKRNQKTDLAEASEKFISLETENDQPLMHLFFHVAWNCILYIKDRDIDITKPRYDQSTYWGRARHFFETTNPLNLFASQKQLEKSKEIVLLAKAKKWDELKHLSDDEIWRAKALYDSAYHPDTGELMIMIGRMSAQVPMNMAITGCMMNFYKSTKAVVFWQWVNQSFNALVNYTNRSGDGELSTDQIMKSYVMATGGALVTALSLNKVAVKFPPLVGRIVPFVAVAAANCINIPMMRLQELEKGIPVSDENGNVYGDSKNAAKAAIAAVTFSRVAMASPGMELEKGIPVIGANGERYGDSTVAAQLAIANTVISRNGMCAPGMIMTPIAMNSFDKKGFFKRYPWSSTPLSVLICGVVLTFATPMCCAIFEQRASMKVEDLEDEIKKKIKSDVKVVYYNKGL